MAPPASRLTGVEPAYQPRAQAILDSLQSYFLEMPRGSSFCERADFEIAYAVLRESTAEGARFDGEALLEAINTDPRAWLVLRAIAGMSPGELAHVASQQAARRGTEIEISQSDAREIDARAKRGRRLLFDQPPRGRLQRHYDALLRTIVPSIAEVLARPAPLVAGDRVHRLDRFDTTGGHATIASALSLNRVPYSELLYERMLGRPFASHRDSVSGIVGRLIESAIEELLDRFRIDGRATLSRESIPGFVQAPDFLIPADNARVIIEAKLTEDDGTARDKVARVQTLRHYEDERPEGDRRSIIAVVDGRGFGHRVADLGRLLKACDGHVYTLRELDRLVGKDGPLRSYVGTRAD